MVDGLIAGRGFFRCLTGCQAMRKIMSTLTARCITRSGLFRPDSRARLALFRPDPRARLALLRADLPALSARGPPAGSRNASEHWESNATAELGSIPQPVFNIDVLVVLLRQENAKDICVIKLPMEIKYTDYFIIVSGTSSRHLQAMAQYAVKVHKHLKGGQTAHVHIEGKDTDDWKCIDFGNIVVHFMLPETREIYELEKLWTLRTHDDQFAKIPAEILPTDFVYGPTDDMDQKSDFKGLS
ncbi:mitochondrial assembly of ribosomal large subunit protein 1 [Carcharodon carcharias]|uniref:mitochondrial assembly of ribosomal large subunit protein 1 n=1 Tax=Carcharodon carcharias TaxID=13397 RepID=UPI001B7E5536|nr:mitochondrial assembly of ribosomal large subunit protein 1 [Carcharodon carcharias]